MSEIYFLLTFTLLTYLLEFSWRSQELTIHLEMFVEKGLKVNVSKTNDFVSGRGLNSIKSQASSHEVYVWKVLEQIHYTAQVASIGSISTARKSMTLFLLSNKKFSMRNVLWAWSWCWLKELY